VSLPAPGLGLETRDMKAPKSRLIQAAQTNQHAEAQGLLGRSLLGSARFFQKWISPIDGPRCSFSPTCSQFGYEAVHDHGPFLGVVMTADRLMRCTTWTEAGPNYQQLPNGALHDPVANNLLSQP
jgi:putative membrane protein insertion efficiency factor